MRERIKLFRAFLRVALLEAQAYRFESVIWLLSTTMPFVMMALFRGLTETAPLAALAAMQMLWGDFVA